MHPSSEHHVLPLRVYWLVFAALVVGTILTVVSAKENLDHYLPRLNTLVALGIASVKALLVILFFMHVKYQSKLMRLFVAAGFVWLTIMLVITMTDFGTRTWD